MCFINGLGLVVIGTSKGTIHVIELDKNEAKYLVEIQASQRLISRLTADIKCKQVDNSLSISSNIIYCSDESGAIKLINLVEESRAVVFKNSKSNTVCYNPYRQARESFEMLLKKGKF
jgi:hypothetical protein